VVRLRTWLDPGVPASAPAGLVSSVLTVTVVTLLIYPLKHLFDTGALDGLYIPVILFLAAKWNVAMGVLGSVVGALEFSYFHLEPVHHFSGLVSETIAFAAVVAGALYVHVATVRARSAEERRRQEVAARARVVAAADDERRRVVRDLHDGAQQRLAATAMTLRAALANLDGPEPAARELVEEALEQAEHANTELRELAQGILPPALTRGGLRAGVTALLSRMPLAVAVDIPEQRFGPAVESTAYFVISEALTNVIKHAQARHVAVTAAVRDGNLQVDVVDDGIGGADTTALRGLGGLQDRVSAIGGQLTVQSPRGKGTRIRTVLPLTE
jgi:signal transduction histidine kinase